MMALADFLHDLFTAGDARPDPEAWTHTDADADAARTLLAQAGARDAHHLPGEAPAFDGPTALWAAAWFHEACRLLLRRDVGEEAVKRLAQGPAPTVPSAALAGNPMPTVASTVQETASIAWSADLTLRHLPEFLHRAVMLSPDDPLVRAVREMAAAWPLSGAGIQGLAAQTCAGPALAAVLAHPALRRLLADRLVAAEDPTWLADPGCRAAVAEALGAQTAVLAPALAEALGVAAEAAETTKPPPTVTTPVSSATISIPSP